MTPPDVSTALAHLEEFLRNAPVGRESYGYELYVPNVIRHYADAGRIPLRPGSTEESALSRPFLDAAWELCRRGILRPGVTQLHKQATVDGSAGCGFSITPFGREWLAEPEQHVFVPTEPEQFARLLAPYATRFGAGFHQRAQQALLCYRGNAALACCAMCGAAAESILLAAAIAKLGEDVALKTYAGAQGRSRIEKELFGKVDKWIHREVDACTALLKYWRDESAHGRAVEFGESEAFTSLALLLRFANMVDKNWSALAGPPAT